MASLSGLSPGAVARKTGQPCTQCGQRHLQKNGSYSCNGHLSTDNKRPCRAAPIAGGEVCRFHGGGIPAVKEAARKRVVWAETQSGVAKLLRECDLPEQHPIDGLLEVVRHSGAMMRVLGYIVSGLDANDEKAKFAENALARYDINMDQQQNVYVEMYGQWADRYARACKLALDANIDERIVRNAEATTGVFLEAFQGALSEAQLDPEQARRFSQALADRLRKVGGPLPR